MSGSQHQERDRQRHMQEQPAVQPVIETFQFHKLRSFRAKHLQFGHFVVGGARKLALGEDQLGADGMEQPRAPRGSAVEKGPNLCPVERFQAAGDVGVDVFFLLHVFDEGVGAFEHLSTDARNLIVGSFAGDAGADEPRQKLLQHQPVNAGRQDGQQDDPEGDFDRSAPSKATMTEDENGAERAEPDMSAQPGFAGAEPPPARHTSQRREQSRVDHQAGANDAIPKTDNAAAAQPARGVQENNGIEDERGRAHSNRQNHPFGVMRIDKQGEVPGYLCETAAFIALHCTLCRSGAMKQRMAVILLMFLRSPSLRLILLGNLDKCVAARRLLLLCHTLNDGLQRSRIRQNSGQLQCLVRQPRAMTPCRKR